MNLKIYKYLSLAKLFFGLLILFFVHFFLNPYEDPVVALTSDAIGIFLFLRGGSFFIFKFFVNLSKKNYSRTKVYQYSYKLAILFGFFGLLNLLLIFGGLWNKVLGLLTLIVFFILQFFVE